MPVRSPNDIKRFRLVMRPPLNQRELGRCLGCTQSDVSAYERGEVVPSLEMALRIARTLGRRVREVFYGLDERVLAYFHGEDPNHLGRDAPADLD